MSAIIAAGIGVVGLFLYGFIAWFCKRLITQLDQLVQVTDNLVQSIARLSLRVKFLENKVYPEHLHTDDDE